MAGGQASILQRGFRFLKLRIKDLPPVWKFAQRGQWWLYQHRYLRMDANETINDKERREFHLDRYRFAKQLLQAKLNADALVLDSACGTGYGSALLGELGVQVTGVDISPEAVAYAQHKYANAKVGFVCADVTSMSSVLKSSFDAVVSFETIEHIPHPTEFLKEVHRVLKKDGLLIISTPNAWGPTKDHHFDYNEALLKEHLSAYFIIEDFYVQNSGCMDLWVNRHQPKRLVKADALNTATAECFIALGRKK